MRLYLVRHGEASNEPGRPLSATGHKQAQSVARQARDAGIAPRRILHSPKMRARQTAEILAAALHPIEILEVTGLLPDDDVTSAADLAEHADEDFMLVGHLPFMGILAHILTGQEIAFYTATIACLEKTDSKPSWRCVSVITPVL